MLRIGLVTVGLALLATSALAADKRNNAGTLAREAVPARTARPAEIAKDATPPKAGRRKLPGDYRKASTVAPRITFERVR